MARRKRHCAARLTFRKRLWDPATLCSPVTLDSLGALHLRRGLYAEAEPYYQRAVLIRERALGLAHPELAASLSNLGNLYVVQRKYLDAKARYLRALDIQEKALGPESLAVATTLTNLSVLLDRQGGQYAEAVKYALRALKIREKTLGPTQSSVAASLSSLRRLSRKRRAITGSLSRSTRGRSRFMKSHSDPATPSRGQRAGRWLRCTAHGIAPTMRPSTLSAVSPILPRMWRSNSRT